MDENDYFADLQYKKDFEEIEKAIKVLNNGRNKDCWPLCSFGWKDADLDPSGCTGISKIVHLDDFKVSVEVGGHKTFCPAMEYDPTDEEQELIFNIGYPGDWSGDDWIIYMERQTIDIPWIMNEELGEPDYQKTAEAIVTAAKEAVEDFEKTMREASEDWEKIGEEDDSMDSK
jgi:hypothetical protein